ncbi:type VII secretion target, partial [Nocardia tengchongensis]|uniref:type VII secretion target n=1 Tax=Nocardia tengchongensis TaxID=2055889 RepID=UPI003682FF7D
MAENVDVDPAVLRKLAAQHDQTAGEIEEWSKQPTTFLANFRNNYGAICDPVRSALGDYYHARELAGLALADQHRRTGDALRQAADDFEAGDQHGAAQITGASDPATHAPSGTNAPSSASPASALPGGVDPAAQPSRDTSATPTGANP